MDEGSSRRMAEKTFHEQVADTSTPQAQQFIRDSMKKNRVTNLLMVACVAIPCVVLPYFYVKARREMWSRWKDPYELPPGFDPLTGRFAEDAVDKAAPAPPPGMDTAPPTSLLLRQSPGSYVVMPSAPPSA